MSHVPSRVACTGCGAVHEESGTGDRHPYVGASAGCWAVYGRALVRARDLAGPGVERAQRLLLDAYAVAHPGSPDEPGSKSVAVHLVGLSVVFERGGTPEEASETMALAVRAVSSDDWVEPPSAAGIAAAWSSVSSSIELDDGAFIAAIERFAAEVWASWSSHHGRVARRVDELLRQRAAS